MREGLGNKELKKIFLLLSFSFLVLLLDRLRVLQPVKGFSERLFLPSKKAIFRKYQEVKEVPEVKDGDRIRKLSNKIEELENKIAQLSTINYQLSTKNKAAQRLLGTPLPPEWQFMPAQTAGLVDGILTIDKGEIDGVKVGQAVLIEDIFVGKVERMGEHQAWVKLPVAKGGKLLVKVMPSREMGNETKARGLLVGYGDKMRLEKVLQEEQLAEGDLVVTGEFPPNLVVGKIEKVIKNEVKIYQEAEVEPILDYKSLEVVFLLK